MVVQDIRTAAAVVPEESVEVAMTVLFQVLVVLD
jgi:hypothetical protein